MNDRGIKLAAFKDALKALLYCVFGSVVVSLLLYLRQTLNSDVDIDRVMIAGGCAFLFSIGVSIYIYFEHIRMSRVLSQRKKNPPNFV